MASALPFGKSFTSWQDDAQARATASRLSTGRRYPIRLPRTKRKLGQEWDRPLFGAAVLVFALVAVRVSALSITIDEADSYLSWIRPTRPSYWTPAANNHVLNTLVTRFFTTFFGLSIFTLRSGALLGAAIYLAACYSAVTTLAKRQWLRWPLFLCLTVNPFVQDYLAVSRGYALALGFLFTAIAIAVRSEHSAISILRRSAAVSVCAALSLSANFAFAFAAVMVVILFLKAHYWQENPLKVAACCVLPGAAVALALCGPALIGMPHSQLYYGASSLREMLGSLVNSTIYELNPFVVNPLLLPPLKLAGWIMPLTYAVLSALVITHSVTRHHSRACKYLVGIVAGALLLHWLGLRLFHVLLPKERTGLFFVPLSMLAFGAATAVTHLRGLQVVCTGLLSVAAIYFVGCLRLTHTHEWPFDADTRAIYGVLRQLERREVITGWEVHRPLQVYSIMYGEEERFDFQGFGGDPPPSGKGVYVLIDERFRDFIVREKLEIVYRGEKSGAVVAIGPGIAGIGRRTQ